MKRFAVLLCLLASVFCVQAQVKGTDSSVETFSLKNGGHSWTHRYDEGIGQTSIVGGQMHIENFTMHEWMETHCDDLVDMSSDFEISVNVAKGLTLGKCSVGLIFNSKIYEPMPRYSSCYDAFFVDGNHACIGHFENGQISNRIMAPISPDVTKSKNSDFRIGITYEMGRLDFTVNGNVIMSTFTNITTQTIGLILGPSTEVAVFDSINIVRKSQR